MEYHTILDIIRRIGGKDATLTGIAAAIQCHICPDIAAMIMTYRGLEFADIPQFRNMIPDSWALLADSKNGYMPYIIHNDITDHIDRVIDTIDCDWHNFAYNFNFRLDIKTMAFIAARCPGKIRNMFHNYLEYATSDESKLSLYNACVLVAAIDFSSYELYETLTGLEFIDDFTTHHHLRSIIAEMPLLGFTVPAAVLVCADMYAADLAMIAAADFEPEE